LCLEDEMSKTTINIGKQTAEMAFYAEAEILVSTPSGEGVFYGTTHSRGQSREVFAKVCYANGIVLVPLSDVKILKHVGVAC